MYSDEVYEELIKECLQLLSEDINEYSKFEVQKILVKAYMGISDFQTALYYNDKVFKRVLEVNTIDDLALIHYNYTNIYVRLKKYEIAMHNLKKSMLYYEKLENYERIGIGFNSMGIIYEYYEDLEQSKECFKKALEYEPYLKDFSLYTVLLNICNIEVSKGNYENVLSSLKHMRISIEKIGHLRLMSYMYRIYALAYYGIGEYEHTKKFYYLANRYVSYLKNIHEEVEGYKRLLLIAKQRNNVQHIDSIQTFMINEGIIEDV